MEFKFKYYAVEEKEDESVRLVLVGNKPNDRNRYQSFFSTIYGKLRRVHNDEFERKNGYYMVVRGREPVAHLWSCYSYEEYKEEYERQEKEELEDERLREVQEVYRQ